MSLKAQIGKSQMFLKHENQRSKEENTREKKKKRL